jgi:serine/threonine protein kinase
MKSPENNSPTAGCDLQRLRDFLNSDHYHLEDPDFLAHLDVCSSCRDYLEAQAGEPECWEQASKLLKTLEFDQASSTEYSAATHGGADASQPVTVKDVLDLLVPSEYPNHLGRLGAYEVTGVIGVGGMGVVLKAIDPSLDRVVAVKVMSPKLAHNENARKRFAREAKAAAAVLHPNVIPIHSVSSGTTLPYLVMSYIRGGSLQKRLDQDGPLPLVEVLRIGSQIAAGLAAAHEQGLIHRDIKPENILLEEGVERVTITDFGLARSVDDNTITQMGSIAGTPQYMSPEQACGEQLDQKSDLFSLGSVLYALCTGRPPYVADSSYGVMRKIIDDYPKPIHEINPAIPEWFAKIIRKLMARDKADRFESAGEVHKLLEACLSHVQQPNGYRLPDIPNSHPQPVQSNTKRVRKMIKFAAGMITMAIFAMVVLPFVRNRWSAPTVPSYDHLVPYEHIKYDVPEITVALAERLIGKEEAVTFTKVTSLEPEVAAVLSKHPGNLNLPAITHLAPEVARALVSKNENTWLGLNGLNEISPDLARELAAAKCALRLDGVDTVTPEVAEILATHQGSLCLGLTSITPNVSEKLAMHEAWLNLNSLATMDVESAALLAKHKQWLSLDGLKSLTVEIAEALGHYDGDKLDLNGLETLELEVAKRLANAKCASGIYLNGLKEVSPDVIQVLANGNYDLSFQGLEFMDIPCEQALDEAEKKLQSMRKHMLIRKSDQPLLNLDSHHQEGSHDKGETLSHLWKLRGQSVGSIGVRALHIKDGSSRVVSEGVFPVAAQRQQSMEVQLQLRSLDEPLSANGIIFVPSLSIAVNGITTNAHEGEKFAMLGEFTTHSFSTGGHCEYESTIMSAASKGTASFAKGAYPSTIEAMTAASKKGVEFFVVILTWQPTDEANQKVGSAALGI